MHTKKTSNVQREKRGEKKHKKAKNVTQEKARRRTDKEHHLHLHTKKPEKTVTRREVLPFCIIPTIKRKEIFTEKLL